MSYVVDAKLSFGKILAQKRGDSDGTDWYFTQPMVARELKARGYKISQGTLSNIEHDIKEPESLSPRELLDLLRLYCFGDTEIREISLRFDLPLPPSFAMPGRGVTDKGPKVRLLGVIGAGMGKSHTSDAPTKVSVPDWIAEKYDLDDVFAVDVVGSSMTCEIVAKTIPEGSRVFFHSKLEPKKNQVIACYLELQDISVMKLYLPEKGYTVLESWNPLYRSEPIVIDKSNPGVMQGVCLAWDVRAPGFE